MAPQLAVSASDIRIAAMVLAALLVAMLSELEAAGLADEAMIMFPTSQRRPSFWPLMSLLKASLLSLASRRMIEMSCCVVVMICDVVLFCFVLFSFVVCCLLLRCCSVCTFCAVLAEHMQYKRS